MIVKPSHDKGCMETELTLPEPLFPYWWVHGTLFLKVSTLPPCIMAKLPLNFTETQEITTKQVS